MIISGLSDQELTSSLFTTEKDENFKPKSQKILSINSQQKISQIQKMGAPSRYKNHTDLVPNRQNYKTNSPTIQ